MFGVNVKRSPKARSSVYAHKKTVCANNKCSRNTAVPQISKNLPDALKTFCHQKNIHNAHVMHNMHYAQPDDLQRCQPDVFVI